MNDRFNIAIKVKKFIFMVDDLVINYPKKDYVMKDRLLNTCYDLLELIYRANYSNDKDCYKFDILSKISIIDFCLEESYHKKIISERKILNYTNFLKEITKMVYGWIDDNKAK